MKRIALLLLVLLPTLSTAMSSEASGLRSAIARHAERQAARERRLYGARIPAANPSTFRFLFGMYDLNGDGTPDAIVLFDGPADCGSGGCTLEVYRGTKHGFRFVSGSTISRQPIRILHETHFGWHTFTVSVGGGGAEPCNALMRFNGHKYPLNPSMAPCATAAQIESGVKLRMKPQSVSGGTHPPPSKSSRSLGVEPLGTHRYRP